MRRILDRIRNSEFLTFSEVLKLKVAIVTFFLTALILLTIPLSSFNDFTIDINVFVPMSLGILILITILLVAVNLNRFAMHTSTITIIILTLYYSQGSNHFYGYIMFFVALTIVIFYQDIISYLIYGGLIITGTGIYYIFDKGSSIVGTTSLDPTVSLLTYLVILVGFYIVFLIQFLISDNIYEKMNNEWVRMNKILSKYQDFSYGHLKEMVEEQDQEPLWLNSKFQQTISELSVFMNEFFEEDAHKITEAVEYYFFLHTQEVDEIIENKNASIIAKRYALQFDKYLISKRSELTSMLFDFATLFKPSEDYNNNRYNYNLNDLLHDRIDKLLSLAILYRYLKTEVTKFDKWGNIKDTLTHEEITEMFVSKDFREFISYEQVNFFLDNEELFDKYL